MNIFISSPPEGMQGFILWMKSPQKLNIGSLKRLTTIYSGFDANAGIFERASCEGTSISRNSTV